MAQSNIYQDIYPKGLEDTFTIIDLDSSDFHITLNNSLSEIYFTLVKNGQLFHFSQRIGPPPIDTYIRKEVHTFHFYIISPGISIEDFFH